MSITITKHFYCYLDRNNIVFMWGNCCCIPQILHRIWRGQLAEIVPLWLESTWLTTTSWIRNTVFITYMNVYNCFPILKFDQNHYLTFYDYVPNKKVTRVDIGSYSLVTSWFDNYLLSGGSHVEAGLLWSSWKTLQHYYYHYNSNIYHCCCNKQ